MAQTRRQATTGDLIRTLVVIVIPLLVIVAFFTQGPRDHPVTPVDWRPVLAQARAEAPYPVLAPQGLPESWRATSVSWVRAGNPALNGDPSPRNAWKLGFLSPDDVYVGLAQGDVQPERFLDDLTRSGAPSGESRVGNERWERWVSEDGRTRSLVQQSEAVTTVVVSDGDWQLLEAYAATLVTT